MESTTANFRENAGEALADDKLRAALSKLSEGFPVKRREAADRLGLRLSIHLGWGQAEVDMVQATHGMHPFDYVERNGFLASDVVCAHCYHVGEEQVDRLAHAGAHVAHCLGRQWSEDNRSQIENANAVQWARHLKVLHKGKNFLTKDLQGFHDFFL